MADTTWFTTLTPQLIAGVDPANTAAVTASVAALQTRLVAATDAQGAQLRNSFLSAAIGEQLAAAGAADASALAPVTAAIHDVQAVLTSPLALLSDLQAKAEPLRLAAQTAWRVAATAGQAARTLERAERLLAAAAGTGAPPVVGAWAIGRQLDAAALDTAEAAAQAAKVADQAWASVQHVIDEIRKQVLAPVAAINSVLSDTVRLMTSLPGSPASTVAYSTLHTDLVHVFNTVVPGP